MIKNTVIYTIGSMLPNLIVFLMLPIYMNYLTPEEYGLIQTINALVGVLSIFYLTSLRTSVTRSYIDYDSAREKRGFILSVFLFLVTFSFFLSLILLKSESFITPFLFNNIPTDPYYSYMILLSFLSIFPTIPLTILRIKEQAFKYVTFNATETLLTVVLTVYLLIVKDMGAVGSLQAIIYARIIMAIIYLIFIASITRLKIPECRVIYITSSLALALPLVPHFLAAWVNNVGDRIIIEQFLDLYQLGIYALGAQFNAGLILLVTSFNMAFAPRFFKMMKKEEVNQKFYSKVFDTAILLILIISLLGLILVPLFIKYFGHVSYQSNYLFIWSFIWWDNMAFGIRISCVFFSIILKNRKGSFNYYNYFRSEYFT
ncbi:oligosaccharide flippase family protein [Bacillus sp. m3-13]|uniref:oligosaccharide flippase family protein n=1 Tax=Bacillus sp. m3-13 TaxID=406124 RepID=UPI0012F68B72|nr:oligosaccharide flippase family protein [Bacillus sp. m3-13]